MLAAALLVLALQAPRLEPVAFRRVHLADGFFAPRIEANRKVTIEACLAKCEETGRIRNFAVAGGLETGKHEGLLFNDSDVYKVIEGVAYTLAGAPDPVLEKRTDAIVEKIAAAQREDGYLDTYFQLVEPENRWKKEKDGHELYCAGHLIEAAVAYEQATGKRKLLDVAVRFADCIGKEYGWGKHQEATGHEELELALMKLFRRTGEKRFLELAKFFLDVRGKKDRGTPLFGEYAQDHLPVREQTQVVGHAVRAMYLYCGMADVAAATGDATLLAPLVRIWNDLVGTKMYATGGIGSSAANEGFTRGYDLPNDTAYCETCAAIGMALWGHRMFLATGETRYADVLEREVYNGVPSGVSLSGDRFFYENPLASRGDRERVPWFDCSCCPSNVVRFLPAMGERLYATTSSEVHAILYAASTAEIDLGGKSVRLAQVTDYPRSGDVRFKVGAAAPIRFALCLRVPDWCEAASVEPAGSAVRRKKPGNDEIVVEREWKDGDAVLLHLAMPPRRVHADPNVVADHGRVALARGPVVYALEAADNADRALAVCLPPDAKVEEGFEPGLLGGTTVLRAKTKPADLVAIPYCLWANRDPGAMLVWIAEEPGLAETLALRMRAMQNGVRLDASHCWRTDTLLALNDGVLPKSSADESIPRLTFWDHKGTKEWVEMEFESTRAVHAVRVYWFDDTGHGGCRTPASARVLVRDGETWREVAGSLPVLPDRWNPAEFPPATTGAVRIEVALRPGFSAGILEWQVE
jgi:DUF1680 family protein